MVLEKDSEGLVGPLLRRQWDALESEPVDAFAWRKIAGGNVHFTKNSQKFGCARVRCKIGRHPFYRKGRGTSREARSWMGRMGRRGVRDGCGGGGRRTLLPGGMGRRDGMGGVGRIVKDVSGSGEMGGRARLGRQSGRGG
ncbi:MAG: hypothetical protein Aurels2KO_57080 [Aureliella sp.]